MFGLNVLGTAAFQVIQRNISTLPHGISHMAFTGNGHHIKSVAEKQLLPVAVAYAPIHPAITGTAPAAVVLQSAINVVGNIIVNVYMVKLTYGNILGKTPVNSPVITNVYSAIISVDEHIRVFGVNVKCVMIRVNMAPVGKYGPVFTAILAARHLAPKTIDTVFVFGIYVNFVVVERAIAHILLTAYFFPGISAVVAGKEVKGFAFHNGIYPVGLIGGYA